MGYLWFLFNWTIFFWSYTRPVTPGQLGPQKVNFRELLEQDPTNDVKAPNGDQKHTVFFYLMALFQSIKPYHQFHHLNTADWHPIIKTHKDLTYAVNNRFIKFTLSMVSSLSSLLISYRNMAFSWARLISRKTLSTNGSPNLQIQYGYTSSIAFNPTTRQPIRDSISSFCSIGKLSGTRPYANTFKSLLNQG